MIVYKKEIQLRSVNQEINKSKYKARKDKIIFKEYFNNSS